MFDWLARLAYMRSRPLVVAAIVFMVAGGAVGGSVFGVLKPFGFDDPASESIQTRDSLAAALLAKAFVCFSDGIGDPGGFVRILAEDTHLDETGIADRTEVHPRSEQRRGLRLR